MTLIDSYRRAIPLGMRQRLSRALNWPEGADISFSAYGEDRVIRGWLDVLGVPREAVRYMDAGASHPSILSNSYLFYRMGGSGVLVEPTPKEASLLIRRRPRDVLLQVGLAEKRGTTTLFQFDPSVYNTTDPEQAIRLEAASRPERPIRKVAETPIELVPIMDVVASHFGSRECHLLSIDIEGGDSAIISSIDFAAFRPWFICCERPDDAALSHLLDAGYRLIAEVPHSRIFARSDLELSL